MSKAKILGISKSVNRLMCIIEKKQDFIPSFREFLSDLGYNGTELDYFCRSNENGNDLPIESLTDHSYNFQDSNLDVDTIIGDKKIFIVIHSKSDIQEQFSEKIVRYFAAMSP